jgi:hypothetical protein
MLRTDSTVLSTGGGDMRIKVLLALSVLTGALSVFAGAAPAHACSAELPSTACVVHDVCMFTGGKPSFC